MNYLFDKELREKAVKQFAQLTPTKASSLLLSGAVNPYLYVENGTFQLNQKGLDYLHSKEKEKVIIIPFASGESMDRLFYEIDLGNTNLTVVVIGQGLKSAKQAFSFCGGKKLTFYAPCAKVDISDLLVGACFEQVVLCGIPAFSDDILTGSDIGKITFLGEGMPEKSIYPVTQGKNSAATPYTMTPDACWYGKDIKAKAVNAEVTAVSSLSESFIGGKGPSLDLWLPNCRAIQNCFNSGNYEQIQIIAPSLETLDGTCFVDQPDLTRLSIEAGDVTQMYLPISLTPKLKTIDVRVDSIENFTSVLEENSDFTMENAMEQFSNLICPIVTDSFKLTLTGTGTEEFVCFNHLVSLEAKQVTLVVSQYPSIKKVMLPYFEDSVEEIILKGELSQEFTLDDLEFSRDQQTNPTLKAKVLEKLTIKSALDKAYD